MKLTFDVDRLLLPVTLDFQETLENIANESGKLTSTIQVTVLSLVVGTLLKSGLSG